MPSSGITISNTFATQSGFVPVSQIDVDFAQLVTALNTLTTFGNYYVDSGGANGIVITVPLPLIAAYTAGLPLQVMVVAANADVGGSGATTINMNGLGARNLTYPSAAALLPGQLSAGGIISVMYDGTRFQYLGPVFGKGQFVGTTTGFASGPTPTVVWSISDFHAMVVVPFMTGTSNATTFGIANLPAYLQPARTQYTPGQDALFINNSSAITVATGAAVTIAVFGGVMSFVLNGGSNWTASGTKGVNGNILVPYLLN